MNNLWPDYIKDLKGFETPKSILESQSKFLSESTSGEVYASVDEVKRPSFVFEFNIRGKYLENYKFTAFTIEHGIEIYPLTICPDEDIAIEIGADSFLYEVVAKNPEEFVNILINIFKSNKMKHVIQSIKSLSY